MAGKQTCIDIKGTQIRAFPCPKYKIKSKSDDPKLVTLDECSECQFHKKHYYDTLTCKCPRSERYEIALKRFYKNNNIETTAV